MKQLASLLVIFLAVCFCFALDYVLTIEMNPVFEIPKTLFGIFFEDINFAVDGGLYAELIRNRSFEHTFVFDGWSLRFDEELVDVSIESSEPLNVNNKNYLRIYFKGSDEEVMLINTGYGGIPLKINEVYVLSFYVRTNAFCGEVSVSIENKKEEKFAEGTIKIQKEISNWTKLFIEFVPRVTTLNSQFVMRIKGRGELHLDMISLMPKTTWYGMRKDLVEVLKELKPGFLRFPGGCLVEGDSLQNAYRWKDTIGPVEQRKTNKNLWGYYQSYGIGFYEYLLLAEYLGAEPVPIFNSGISCQVRGAEYCPMENLNEWVQDVLDFLEFANGPVDSYWGSIRAKLGHPEPFNVKYIGIGNENWGDKYHERFECFQKAIKTKYPDIKIVFSGPPSYEGSNFRYALRWAKENNVDIFDEHIYAPPEWFLANNNRYDRYYRDGPMVMIGEYAAHSPGRQNNWQAALAEAAFLTGIIRNSDVVIMSSYAPLFNRVGGSQWVPDLIWFDSTRVFLTPSYFVQKLYIENIGNYLLPSKLSNEDLEMVGYKFKSIYHVCTYDPESRQIVIFLVNPWPEDRNLQICLVGGFKIKDVEIIRAFGSFTMTNSFEEYSIVPTNEKLMANYENMSFVVKGYSFNVLRIYVE